MSVILIIVGLILLFKFVLTSHAASNAVSKTSAVNTSSCGSAGDNFTSGSGIVAGVSEPTHCNVILGKLRPIPMPAPMPVKPIPIHITYPVAPPPIVVKTPIISPLRPRVYQSGSGTRYNIFSCGAIGAYGGGSGPNLADTKYAPPSCNCGGF